jgi:hypothetical protein
MSYPTIFANLAAGNQPLALFDAMFNVVAQISSIPTTASGQNAITLTPIGSAPALAAYATYCSFRFKAVATSNAAVTVGQTGLALLPVYKRDGTTQAAAGDLVSGNLYLVIYDPALNTGAGGFWLEIATLPIVTTAGGSSVSGLRIFSNAITPDTQVDYSIDEVVMVRPSDGSVIRATNLVGTINAAVSGLVNRLDTGTLTFNTWYHAWAISNGSTSGCVLSLSSSAPTMPSGFTYQKRLGAFHTDITHGQTSTVTITIASPGVVTWNAHGLVVGTPVVFSTTGALPTGIVAGTTYFVRNPAANTFEITGAPYDISINTSGSQSGTHTATVPPVRFIPSRQLGNQAQYIITNPPASGFYTPVIASGVIGTFSVASPVLTAFPVTDFVPPTAASIYLMVATNWRGLGSSNMLIAPNVNWGGTGRGPENPNTGMIWPARGSGAGSFPFDLVLEGSTIAICSSAAGGAVACQGWSDNI